MLCITHNITSDTTVQRAIAKSALYENCSDTVQIVFFASTLYMAVTYGLVFDVNTAADRYH